MALSGQFFDADGDLVSLEPTGAGTLDFALDQPDDKGRGALDHLTLADIDAPFQRQQRDDPSRQAAPRQYCQRGRLR